MGISIRAYARHRKALGLSGGTDTAVHKAIKTGRITPLSDGSIDAARADAQWAGLTDQALVRAPEAQAAGAEKARATIEADERRPVPEAAVKAVQEATAQPLEADVGGGGAVRRVRKVWRRNVIAFRGSAVRRAELPHWRLVEE